MRPIKFRAYNTMENRMHWLDPIDYPFDSSQLIEAPAWKTMQYTGLKDKNGKEIYEGDIVKHRKLDKESDLISYGIAEGFVLSAVVTYQNCQFYPLGGWIDGANEDLEWEVIGNIYENPELLK